MINNRLNTSTLAQTTNVISPNYNPDEHASGIVHIGIGGFHKAHQAVYTDDVLNKFGGDWRITAVSLRNPTARDQLTPQDGLYTVVEKTDTAITHRIIGVIEKVLVAPENSSAVIELLAKTSTKVVSLTITEKGYCHNKGALDISNPQIQNDLKNPAIPTTMPGFIVAACSLRRKNLQPGFSVISCDNLSHNGKITASVVIEFAELQNVELAEWIRRNVSFCSTMVDRIVPATTEQDIIATANEIGVEDQAVVICEPFRQWVIENNFCTERPRWEDVGALIVDDVTPFETMKLRLLNGSHSTLAYVGFLAGHKYIHQAIADPALQLLIENLMDIEVTPTLHIPAGFDIDSYKKTIRTRFANSLVPYKTTQVAMDGSQKLPQRLLDTAVELIQQGYRPKIIPFIIAAWFIYLTGTNEAGEVFDVNDPKAKLLTPIAREIYQDELQQVMALIEASEIFPAELASNNQFVKDIADRLTQIKNSGITQAIKQRLNI